MGLGSVSNIDDKRLAQHRVELAKLKKNIALELFDVECIENALFTPSPIRFTPNGAQERMINNIATGARIVFIGFGNRTGKTECWVNCLINETVGVQNDWFDLPYYHKVGAIKNKLFIIASESEYVKNSGVLQRTIHKYLDKSGIDFTIRKEKMEYDAVYEFRNGSVWKIMSYEQDPKQYEGAQVFRYQFDEPPPELIWRASMSRMMSGARISITATPLSGCAHIYRDVVLQQDGKDIIVMYGDIEENCRQHGVRGYLEHNDIEFAVKRMSEDERQARMHGKFLFLSGNVFKEWNNDIHIIENANTEPHFRNENSLLPKNFPKVAVLDPHDRIDAYIIWVAISPDDTYYVYDEFPNYAEHPDFYDDKTGRYNWTKTAEKIKEHEKEFGAVSYRLVDPRGAHFTVDQEYNVFDFFNKKMGIRIRSQNAKGITIDTNIESGHQLIRDRLQGKKIKVFSRCKHFIYMMQNYRYKENKGKSGEGKSPNEDVEDRYKHAPDCLRYIVQDDPHYVNVEVEEVKEIYDYENIFNTINSQNPFGIMK